jgi:uncharacterized integral membrane protein
MALTVVRQPRGNELPMFRSKFQSVILPITSIKLSLKRLSYSWHEFVKFRLLNIPHCGQCVLILILLYLLTAIGMKPGGSSTVHIYTQTIHRTTQLTTLFGRLSGIRNQSGQTKINNELTA